MTSSWTPNRLKALRESYGESQAKFAPRLRVPVNTLQNWEQGRAVWPAIAEFRFDQLKAELTLQAVTASA